jgi:three-Cys-motif partner protein
MTTPRPPQLDAIGPWSEIKLEIIKKYAAVYSKIVAGKGLYHIYIDAFAGAGIHFSKQKCEYVSGSPLNALIVDPPFREFHFIDLDSSKVEELKRLTEDRENVSVYGGDCNKILLDAVLPRVEYKLYRRALCLLDPYGLHLDWTVVQQAGHMNTIDMFLNFPIMDINRNALRRNKTAVTAFNVERMNRFWGDESWREIGYEKQPTLFGDVEEKVTNEHVVRAYIERLLAVAKFSHVAKPLPIRCRGGPVLYYLIFASQQPVAEDIVKDIFNYYEKRGLN